MDIKPIKTEEEYKQAFERLEEISDAKPGTPEADELEILSMLVDEYEKENFNGDKLKSRNDWNKSLEEMSKNGDDELLINDVFHDENL